MRRAGCLALVVAGLSIGTPAVAQTDTVRVAVVVRIDTPDPVVGVDGEPTAAGREHLRKIVAVMDELAGADVPFTLSVGPVLVDQMQLLAGHGERAYAALLRLADARDVLTRPYADAELSLVDRAGIRAELREGADALERTVGRRPVRIMDAPRSGIDERVLDAAAGEVDAVFVPEGLLDANVTTQGVSLVPYALDCGDDRGDCERDDSYVLDRVIEDGRAAVPLVVDEPGEGTVAGLRRLQTDPRIELVGVPAIVGDPPDGAVSFPRRYEREPRSWQRYREALERAQHAFEEFTSYTVVGNRTRDALKVLLGVARSSGMMVDRLDHLRDRALAIVEQVEQERELVSAADGSVTLTSRSGAVPVTVRNLAPYPVRLRVRVASSKLTFPDGASKVVTISPRGDTVTFTAETRSTGTFPMSVRLSSPDGRVLLDRSEILVRSTAANIVALVLTVGAALFLVGWYARSFLRRRGLRA